MEKNFTKKINTRNLSEFLIQNTNFKIQKFWIEYLMNFPYGIFKLVENIFYSSGIILCSL